MQLTRTFLDANILIAMTNLTDASVFRLIREVLKDERREFVANDFLRLEVLPKPTRNKRQASIDFCEKYFRNCAHYVETNRALLEAAYVEACRLGLSATDAIHIASAHIAQAQELITLEKPTKPMYKSKLVKVVYLHDIQ
jgi:predicted nucleic acid-binding protein